MSKLLTSLLAIAGVAVAAAGTTACALFFIVDERACAEDLAFEVPYRVSVNSVSGVASQEAIALLVFRLRGEISSHVLF